MALADFEELYEDEHEYAYPKNQYEVRANEALAKVHQAKGFIQKTKALKEYRKRLMIAYYRDIQNPKTLEFDELKEIVMLSAENDLEAKYLARVRGPTAIIRAYCVRCVGDIASVRNCTTINCPLFPFRMGSNPFYGKTLDGDSEFTEADEYQGEDPLPLVVNESVASAD